MADADGTEEDSNDIESTEESDVSELENAQQGENDGEISDDENSMEDSDNNEAADEGELNEHGVPEALMQQLYDCVEEAVLTGYIEPNGIDPAEFQWPADDAESHVFAWSYLRDIYTSYLDTGSMYDISHLSFEKPDDSVCQLMNSVLDGMVKWKSNVPKKIYKINISYSPISELFSENIEFTD